MSNIAEIYTDAVHENFKPLYANWDPGTKISLGDFGVLRDQIFTRFGNIGDAPFSIQFEKIEDAKPDNKSFSSEESVEVKFNAKGSTTVSGVANAKATLDVSFSNKDAVFFNAAGCIHSMIRSKVTLGKDIMAAYNYGDGEWQREWVIVSDLVTAKATTIAISSNDTASIVFEAKGDVDKIDLADAGLGLDVRSYSNIGYKVAADEGGVLLLGLCQIQSTFLWWNDKFKPLSRSLSAKKILDAMENSKFIESEESKEAVYFGQLK